MEAGTGGQKHSVSLPFNVPLTQVRVHPTGPRTLRGSGTPQALSEDL